MSATLISNSGDSELTIEFLEAATYRHDFGFESIVSIRTKLLDGEGTDTLPVTSVVEGLRLRVKDLMALHNHLTTWINQPLELVLPERLNGSFDLALLLCQELKLSFGARSDTISGLNPVVSISVTAGAFRCACHFVTDQSCLNIFASEINREMGKAGIETA